MYYISHKNNLSDDGFPDCKFVQRHLCSSVVSVEKRSRHWNAAPTVDGVDLSFVLLLISPLAMSKVG